MNEEQQKQQQPEIGKQEPQSRETNTGCKKWRGLKCWMLSQESGRGEQRITATTENNVYGNANYSVV